jgi:hypothetical protein
VSKLVDIKSTFYAAMAVAVLAMALVLPTQAVAETECVEAGSDPTAAQYCTSIEIPPPTTIVTPPAEVVEVEAESAESTQEVAGTSSGSLPFTGADLLVLAAVAAAFVAIGLALQRLSRAKTDPR